MPRGRADIANTAVRILLHDMGVAYDEERGLEPFKKTKHFGEVKAFFGEKCCYCGTDFSPADPAVEDHLVPTNRTDLGLHAWGNIVPACRTCNAEKQGSDWRDFIIQRAGTAGPERHGRMRAFLEQYRYEPSVDLRAVAAELYDEVGEISMTLIRTKIKRLRAAL